MGVVAACTFTFFFFFSCRPRCPGIVSMCRCGYHQVPFLSSRFLFCGVIPCWSFLFLLLFLLWAHDIYLLKFTLRPFCCTYNSRSLSVLVRRLALTGGLCKKVHSIFFAFFFQSRSCLGGLFFSRLILRFFFPFPLFLSLPKMVSRISALSTIQNSAFRSFFKLIEL